MSFYWTEADDGHGAVPAPLTVQVSPHLRAMLGTEQPEPRCIGLGGRVGSWTACTLYAVRPSPCREFAASFENGEPNAACDRARARHGMAPLSPADWQRHDPGRPQRPVRRRRQSL